LPPSIALTIINEYDCNGLLRSHVTHLLPLLLDQLGHCQTVSPREINTEEERSPREIQTEKRREWGEGEIERERERGREREGERERERERERE
jgi:hypothetical protein